MWEYKNATHNNDYLAHSYKYIKREWKNGRWVYTYDDKTNGRFQAGAKPALLRNRYNQKRLDHLNNLEKRSAYAKERANMYAGANIQNDSAKLVKDTTKVMKKGSNSRRAKLIDYSRRVVNNTDNIRRYRSSSELANKEGTRLVREGQAEIASAKSKKSLKRKVKKAYYKTRDAVRSIPSPVSTHKVYKSGNITTVVDERGPLIAPKNNRKTKKKKRG